MTRSPLCISSLFILLPQCRKLRATKGCGWFISCSVGTLFISNTKFTKAAHHSVVTGSTPIISLITNLSFSSCKFRKPLAVSVRACPCKLRVQPTVVSKNVMKNKSLIFLRLRFTNYLFERIYLI